VGEDLERSLRGFGRVADRPLDARLGHAGHTGGRGNGRPLGLAVSGRGELGTQLLVLGVQAAKLGLDLVEELVDLLHVVALAQAHGEEFLVLDLVRSERHLSPR
jgi:hypothetical protein